MRRSVPEWPAIKPTTPFQSIPLLEIRHVNGTVTKLNQSAAILRYVGRLTAAGLYPHDILQAALVDQIVDGCEDAFLTIGHTMRMADGEEKKAAREAALPAMHVKLAALEACCASERHAVGSCLTIADCKIAFLAGLASGNIDHIPTTTLDGYPKLRGIIAHVQAAVAERAAK